MSWSNSYNLQDDTFAGGGGSKIFYRSYQPKEGRKGNRVLVVQHGIGEHGGRYEFLVEALAGTGTALYMIDSRGHGRSEGKRGVVDSFSDFLSDLDQLISIAAEKEKVSKVNLLGHSMGAAIVTLYAEEGTNQGNLNSLVVSALPIRVRLDLVMKIKKGIAPLMADLLPNLTLPTGLDINALSHDRAVVEAYKNDPLVHGMASAYLGNMLLNSEEPILGNAGKIKIPIYIFHGKEDSIADYTGSEAFFAVVGSQDKSLKIYDHLFHETMNERLEDRTKVLSDLKKWFESHTS
ncbi:alpha/beta hydrolase [Leptospira gomenensis]|uniref:Monoacylglycerol lipase n=1 Tax=Leptospira gomenensis TaxID=2484974 RepID=A0A5F1YM38_9LEPT|nr:alpha/beta hydrolase [Leptospira gomenensis]TGK33372.1 alpha/beta hydrolase [Leptospira gomenensis]TGK37333.1 alpha/beta hydrolase [Leptospira gomenensis]TGK40522.1 alpha/beta hydrolase [Leptospira gomenensis]TGK56444.1 alpha/beta hydrolase [Leptospira gomenensis]